MAGGLGFEPRLAESESAVLPLDDPPMAMWRLDSRWGPDAQGVSGLAADLADQAGKALAFLGAGCRALRRGGRG